MRASSLDEMQLACDPSDQSLQFRVSALQINNWLQTSTNSYYYYQQQELLQQQQQQQQQKSSDDDNNDSKKSESQEQQEEEPSKKEIEEKLQQQQITEADEQTTTKSSSSNQTTRASKSLSTAAVSCAVRRLRHFAMKDEESLPNLLSLTTLFNNQQNTANGFSSSSTNIGQNRNNTMIGSPLGAASSASATATAAGILNSPTTASLRRKRTIDNNLVADVSQNVHVPTSTPLVDVEVARLQSLLLVAGKGGIHSVISNSLIPNNNQNQNSSSDNDSSFATSTNGCASQCVTAYANALNSKLHRQMMQVIRLHPMSNVVKFPAAAAMTTTNNNNNNSKKEEQQQQQQKEIKISLLDPVHRQRIRFPVRSEFCKSFSSSSSSSSSQNNNNDNEPHGAMCLFGLFVLALQTNTITNTDVDLNVVFPSQQQQQNSKNNNKNANINNNSNNGNGDVSDFFVLCPQCLAPISLGSLYVDRFMEKILQSCPDYSPVVLSSSSSNEKLEPSSPQKSSETATTTTTSSSSSGIVVSPSKNNSLTGSDNASSSVQQQQQVFLEVENVTVDVTNFPAVKVTPYFPKDQLRNPKQT